MNVSTMAIRINKDTYPIAVACLPAAFAQIGRELVLNSYLVINALQAFPDEQEMAEKVALVNFWVPEELFLEEYDFVGPERKTLFTEVIKMRDAEVKDRPARVVTPALAGQRRRRPLRYGANRFSD